MWTSVSILADADHAERLSDALMERGALSVGIEDADAGTERETPQFGEPGSPAAPLWSHSRVTALFDAGADIAAGVSAALALAGLAPDCPWQSVPVAEQDWVRLTQSQFEPIQISERLWIVPSWHTAADPAAINLVLDPGLAFGTGSHPTTRLCLRWLAQRELATRSLLDYGCGSGILAIAAARMGAGEAWGVDIDPAALTAAQDNAARNGVSLTLRHGRDRLERRFDVVVANILSNPLCVLAPLLAGAVAPGGALALSGILEAQADMIRAAYAPHIDVSVAAVDDGWVLMTGTARPPC